MSQEPNLHVAMQLLNRTTYNNWWKVMDSQVTTGQVDLRLHFTRVHKNLSQYVQVCIQRWESLDQLVWLIYEELSLIYKFIIE